MNEGIRWDDEQTPMCSTEWGKLIPCLGDSAMTELPG
jgi:hypothetical protein